MNGNTKSIKLGERIIYQGTKPYIIAEIGVNHNGQLSSAKKWGHLGGKVLVTTKEAISKLVAARLAADVMGTSTLIIARTDENSANLITYNIDERDNPNNAPFRNWVRISFLRCSSMYFSVAKSVIVKELVTVESSVTVKVGFHFSK